jgi:hypothetical protein
MRSLSVVALALALTAHALAPNAAPMATQRQRFPFPFVDEAGQDSEFKAFRDRLEEDLKRGDLQRLAAVMAQPLRAKWPDSLASIAHHAGRALALGGSFTTVRGAVFGRREFCAPYVYAAFPNVVPPPIRSTFEPYAIIGDRVPARAKPRPDAPVVMYLSWELVKDGSWYDDAQRHVLWAQVTRLDGRVGWVQHGQIRHPTDYHVCFAKIDGQWLMTAFGRDRYPAIQ